MKRPGYKIKRPMDSKGRFKRMLGRRFMVRFHMTLIVIAVVGASLGTSKLLLMAGVSNMVARYPLMVVSGVLVFLVCIKLWLWYIQHSLIAGSTPQIAQQSATVEDAIEAADTTTDVAEAALDVADFIGDLRDAGDLEDAGDVAEAGDAVSSAGEGMLGLLEGEEAGIILFAIAVVAAVFFGVGIFLIWQAPVILAEAAIPAILVAALRKKGRDIDHPHWTGSVLKATWIPIAIALLVAVVAGCLLQAACPQAVTLSQAVQRCVLS